MPDSLKDEIEKYGIYALEIAGTGLLGYGVFLGGRAIYRALTSFDSSSSPSDEFATKVADALIASRGLAPAATGESAQEDSHRVFFIRRRARDLGLADTSLTDGQGLQTLIQRIDQELDQINDFLVRKLGTASARGPYFGGPGGPIGEAALLDLGKYVRQRLLDPPATTEADATSATAPSEPQARALRELDRRRVRVKCIIWRAAAIHTEVWKGTGTSLTLQEDLLGLILDRRLRTVERLQYEASAGATPNGMGSSNIDRTFLPSNNPSTKGGPWRDDFLVRNFEAPSLPRSATDDDAWVADEFFRTSGDLISDPGTPRYNQSGGQIRDWYVNFATDEFDWNAGRGTHVEGRWSQVPDGGAGPGYGWVMRITPIDDGSGNTLPVDRPGTVIANLFDLVLIPTPPPAPPPPPAPQPTAPVPSFNRTDWWNRSWLHSDGLLSALHLEALRHANLRGPIAPGTRPDDLFDSLPDHFSVALDDYFEVRRVTRAPNGIMAPGRNDHFENGSIPLDDLQVGDQVLFETNPVLVALGTTAWDYPTVLVTHVETSPSPRKPAVDLSQLRVQGFGTADLKYSAFQLILSKAADATLKGVQEFIPLAIARLKAKAAADNHPFTPPGKLTWDIGSLSNSDTIHNDSGILRLWNPYGDQWDDPGPWWIWINTQAPIWHGVLGDDVIQSLNRMPGGVVWIANDKVQVENRANRWRAGGASPVIPTGPGFQQPPWEDLADEDAVTDPRKMVFVPLFEPFGGWESYFETKVRFPNDSKWPSKLDPVKSDARWIMGFAKDAADASKVRVIRPQLPRGSQG